MDELVDHGDERATSSPGPGNIRSAPLPDHDLLERELEIATVDSLLERTREGRGGRLLLDGPAGIGKSVLLRALCARARAQRFGVLATEAAEVASQVAFGCARSLLGNSWPADPLPAGESDHDSVGPARTSLQQVMRIVLDLAEEAPLLVAVDDVQWADPASLRWLALLAGHVSRSRVALALAVRGGFELAGGALGELLDDRRAIVVRPAPLSLNGAAALLRRRVGRELDDATARDCHLDTNGNPFLLQTLGDALRQAGVPSGSNARARIREVGSRALARTVAHRLDQLEPAARALVEAAAVVGDVGGPRPLASIAGLDPARAVDLVRHLADVDLVRSADSAEIGHPLVGEAIRVAMSPLRREQLGHAAAAHLLAEGRVEQAAAQLLELPARSSPEVANTLARAAQAASIRGAPDVAATLLERALSEPPPAELAPELRAALGYALLALADERATATLEQALAESAPGPGSADVAAALAHSMMYARRFSDAIEVLDRTAEQLAADHPGLAEQLRAQALQCTGFEPALRPERLKRLRRHGVERGCSELAYRMRLAERANESLGACSPAAETIALAEQSLAGGMLLSGSTSSHATAVLVLAYAGRPAAARVHIQDAIAHSRAAGDIAMLGVQLGFHGEARRLEGDMIASESDLRTGIELLPPGEIGPPFMLSGVLESLVEQDAVEAAEAELRRAGKTGELPDLISSASLLYARGRVRIAAGALRSGTDDLLAAGETLARFDNHEPQTVPWRAAAAPALIELGDHELARALSAEQLEQAHRVDAPHVIGPALRLRGVILGSTEGLRMLTEAVALLDKSFAQLELARALVDLGAATFAAGDRVQARGLLERGAALAEQLGAVALARDATGKLVNAGGRPRREHRRGARGLTPGERRVARLAAEGMTNREIAETLVVSQKTVETHITRAFRKLGIETRDALGRALVSDEGAATRESRQRSGKVGVGGGPPAN